MKNVLKKIYHNNPCLVTLGISIILVLAIGVLDYKTGHELSFFIFYSLPITYAAWYSGKKSGIFISILSAFTWFYADIGVGNSYSQEWIIYWNAGVRLVYFLIITFAVVNFKKHLDIERDWARTDALTGALNNRWFRESFEQAIPLMGRTKSPYALAYIDFDNFKQANDSKGHAVGDQILRRSVEIIKSNIRTSDFIGRMGGDEFAIFMGATDSKGATHVLRSLREKLLDEVAKEDWGVGYSIGCVTVETSDNPNVLHKDLFSKADHLMYEVKRRGKNDILVESYEHAKKN